MLIRLLLLLLWSSESEAASKIFALICRWATSLLWRAISSSSSVSGRWPIMFLVSGASRASEDTWALITTTSTYDLMWCRSYYWGSNGMLYYLNLWFSEYLYCVLDVPWRLVVDPHHPVLLLQAGPHGGAPGYNLWLAVWGNTELWLALITWDTNRPGSAGESLSPGLQTTERPNPWGPRLEQASMLDSEENCFIFCSHRILMFKVFISRLFRFYWLIFKTQCSVSIDKNYTNRFYSFRSARLVPASLILVITRDACPVPSSG